MNATALNSCGLGLSFGGTQDAEVVQLWILSTQMSQHELCKVQLEALSSNSIACSPILERRICPNELESLSHRESGECQRL